MLVPDDSKVLLLSFIIEITMVQLLCFEEHLKEHVPTLRNSPFIA